MAVAQGPPSRHFAALRDTGASTSAEALGPSILTAPRSAGDSVAWSERRKHLRDEASRLDRCVVEPRSKSQFRRGDVCFVRRHGVAKLLHGLIVDDVRGHDPHDAGSTGSALYERRRQVAQE